MRSSFTPAAGGARWQNVSRQSEVARCICTRPIATCKIPDPFSGGEVQQQPLVSADNSIIMITRYYHDHLLPHITRCKVRVPVNLLRLNIVLGAHLHAGVSSGEQGRLSGADGSPGSSSAGRTAC